MKSDRYGLPGATFTSARLMCSFHGYWLRHPHRYPTVSEVQTPMLEWLRWLNRSSKVRDDCEENMRNTSEPSAIPRRDTNGSRAGRLI